MDGELHDNVIRVARPSPTGSVAVAQGVSDLVVPRGACRLSACAVNEWDKTVVFISALLPARVRVRPHGSPNPTMTIHQCPELGCCVRCSRSGVATGAWS